MFVKKIILHIYVLSNFSWCVLLMRYVYIVQCADGSLYTGITMDVERRMSEHNTCHLGATYTKARRPVTLVWSHSVLSRSLAAKEEYRIKHLTKQQKKDMIGI